MSVSHAMPDESTMHRPVKKNSVAHQGYEMKEIRRTKWPIIRHDCPGNHNDMFQPASSSDILNHFLTRYEEFQLVYCYA